ncbi:hypothetical protein UlMin_037476 [Ulmus minor]
MFVGCPRETKGGYFYNPKENKVLVFINVTFLDESYIKDFKSRSKVMLEDISNSMVASAVPNVDSYPINEERKMEQQIPRELYRSGRIIRQLDRFMSNGEALEIETIGHDNDPYIYNEGIETEILERLVKDQEYRCHQRIHSVSISMPSTPIEDYILREKRVIFDDLPLSNGTKSASCELPKASKFKSYMPQNPNIGRLIDRRFDSFKTWSGKLERQITHLRGKTPRDTGPEDVVLQNTDVEALPIDRYYDALEGPKLETLRVVSQAIMWKTLAITPSTKFLHLSLAINLILWCISIALVAIVFSIYLLKVIFYCEAVRREYYHPIRANFLFSPCIALLFLALGAPPSIAENLHKSLWYILMTPILCLELKIYGQWMLGGQRRLSKVSNPSNHLSIVENFVGLHYKVLFVTLYQRLPTNETLRKELHPVFFLFFAAPSVASMAWAKLQGSFDYRSLITYFIALFLYFSLVRRINIITGPNYTGKIYITDKKDSVKFFFSLDEHFSKLGENYFSFNYLSVAFKSQC